MNLKEIDREYLSDELVITYQCPCGEGEVIEYKSFELGFRSHTAYVICNKCKKIYKPIKNNSYYNQVEEIK